MSWLSEEVTDKLESVLRGRTLLMGVGNILRGDDAFGPELVERLRGTALPVIDAGTTPENQIGSSVKHSPEVVLLADAVHMDEQPGTCRILNRDEILANTGFTTHDLSPVLFMERLEEVTGASVMMLAVQPAQLRFGTPMSAPVAETLDELAMLLGKLVSGS